jgi:hypothetical protein
MLVGAFDHLVKIADGLVRVDEQNKLEFGQAETSRAQTSNHSAACRRQRNSNARFSRLRSAAPYGRLSGEKIEFGSVERKSARPKIRAASAKPKPAMFDGFVEAVPSRLLGRNGHVHNQSDTAPICPPGGWHNRASAKIRHSSA